MNGALGSTSGYHRWRPDATVNELLRAAQSLEAMAADCTGRRKAELGDAAGELRELAWRHGGPEPLRRSRRFERGQQAAASA
jgi:hypothetical protein